MIIYTELMMFVAVYSSQQHLLKDFEVHLK